MEKLTSEQMDDLASSLAAEAGIDSVGPEQDDPAAKFFAEEPAEPEPETAPEPEAPKFVHEPTGREFESREELLQYENGWLNDKYGHKVKELEERLEALQSKGEEPRPAEPVSRDELKKKLWPNASDDIRNDAVSDHLLEGMDNALTLTMQPLMQQLQQQAETISKLEQRLNTDALYQEHGVSRAQEQKLAEQHSWLAAISDPAQRVAAMKALAAQAKAPETESRKLADQIPQRQAADHVEGSAGNTLPEDTSGKFEDRLLNSDPKTRLSVFGKLFEDSPEISSQLRGDFTF